MADRNEDLHDALMKAFHEYYKAHQNWVVKGTRKAGIDARNRLLDIRHIAKAQRKVIMNWRYTIDDEKRQRKAQKSKGNGSKTDN